MTLSWPSPDDWKTIVSTLALGVSFISLWFARRNWLQTNRPIISATVETHAGGSESIAYDLAVSNTGNRPAINVRLCVDTKEIEKCLAPRGAKERGPHSTYAQVMRCFSEDGEIPLLINGKTMTNSFAYTRGDDQTFWHYGSSLRISISYADLDGRHYRTSQLIRIKDSAAFAGGMWRVSEDDY